MPLSFLAPVFLAGLAALAIPVLIHLANRPRRQVVEFPSLMFLERVEYRASSRKRLRNLVLFTLRALAVVLLAAAFARPYLERGGAAAPPPDGGRELVVLLDRSASMRPEDRMARARAAVAAEADGLRRGDRATLVLFDRDAVAANRATDQPGVLRRAADTVEAGAGSTRLGPALRLAQSILSGSPLPRRELVLVSDFQRAGWDPDAAPAMPPGTEIRLVPVGGEVANVFIGDVRFRRERFSGRDRVTISATVASRGIEGPRDVELRVDGRVLQRRTVPVEAGRVALVEFDPVTVPERSARGTVVAGSDALPADNAFHFVLSSGRDLRVLVVRSRAGGGPYLARALEAGSDHDVTVLPAARVGPDALADADVVVLDGEDPRDPEALAEFVRAGGGLVAALGPRSRSATWVETGLLPGSLGGTRDAGRGVALTGLRGRHPAFVSLRDGDGGVTAARFYRYRELEVGPGADVLARYGDGSPAVVEGDAGRGRVVVLTSPPDGVWNDLPFQPGFVPLARGVVRHAAGREPTPPWRTVGELLDPASLDRVAPREPEGTGPAGTTVLLTPGDQAIPLAAAALQPLREAGFYEVREAGSGVVVPVAVNLDRRESELERVDPGEVRARISAGEAAPTVTSFAPEDRERRQALWWYFLAGALLMLLTETALSNRLSRRPLPGAAAGEAT